MARYVDDYLKLRTWYYETLIPRRFVLDNGEIVELKAVDLEERIRKEPLFLLYVPPSYINNIYRVLKLLGFAETALRVSKGERYSLVKKLDEPWEHHVKIYGNGLIESEIEVGRDYVEHLGDCRIFVIYETFNYYSRAYDKLHILYKPLNRWITEIIDHFHVRIRPPKILTPWKPIVVTAAVAVTLGILAYALSRLERGEA